MTRMCALTTVLLLPLLVWLPKLPIFPVNDAGTSNSEAPVCNAGTAGEEQVSVPCCMLHQHGASWFLLPKVLSYSGRNMTDAAASIHWAQHDGFRGQPDMLHT